MPPVSDLAFNEEDTPDDLKGPVKSRKKKQKKGTKQKAADEYKDSSSEGPKLSPDLPPTVDRTNPSPPPSPPPHNPDGQVEGGIFDHLVASHEKPALNSNTLLSSEPSPPQDGVLASKDVACEAFRLPIAFNTAQHAPSLSSSPQGGIRLPPAAQPRRYCASPSTHTALPSRDRKTSMTTHVQRPASFYDPPPPHMPQRHFARRPEMDFGSPQATHPDPALPQPSRALYCGFGSLEKANAGTSPAANNVVLVGTRSGLEVHRLLRQRADVAGHLEGLRGSVLDAKILPWTDRHDPFAELRPLVMCVVHGPVVDSEEDLPKPPGSPRGAAAAYQTTVDVYSLVSAELLCTLYKSPPIVARHLTPPSTPIGSLCTAADGPFITVASGVSGEVYVFAPYTHLVTDDAPPFRCIAKLWTNVNTTSSHSTPDSLGTHFDESRQTDTKTPIFALSQRWLAIRPPFLSSSQISLQGTPLVSSTHPDPPGVSIPVSPSPPMINCEVDAPFSNSFLDRMTKQATQELVKGAQWVGEQGKHAWRAYWNRPSPPMGDNVHHASKATGQAEANLFPPTHGHNGEPHSSPAEPASVSIIDLHRLLEFEVNPVKNALAPLVTFGLPDGCSFMSFAPGGLSLLISNQVGDASTVWDLTRITSGKLITPYTPASAGGLPYVVMAARFARQTPSIVADVAWSAHANRVAILTQKGTIHLHELPSSNSRPLLHGGAAPLHVQPAQGPSPGTSPQSDAPVGGFMSNFRTRIPNFPGFRAPTNPKATVRDASVYARNTGRRALKQGVNMAADTALKLKHHEETKIRLQPVQHASCPPRVRWLSGRDSGLIATIVDGKVRLHAVKSNHYEQDKRTALYLTASKRPISEISLYNVSSDIASSSTRVPAPEDGVSAIGTGPRGLWALNRANVVQRTMPGRAKRFSASVVQDKDTNPTYLPFHRSPQVNLFTFATTSVKQYNSPEDAWVFGLPLPPATRITCQHVQIEAPEKDHGDGDLAGFLAELPESFD